ncbi:MAG TPA: flagellar hook assembly protein FlgD [Rhodocyclaceae bacterium]|nr:flagellar hook assembly protein FlgD [Rhodocyclaceae bacterium]
MATSSVNSTNYAQSVYDSLNAKASTTSSSASDTQNRFLTLLTAQLKNQDPLNPMDNAQMTSQLAQISTVDGLERLNTTLQALLDSSSGSQTLQAASMVGHTVLVPGTSMALSKSMGVAGVELASAADNVTVTIKDSNGAVVDTMNLGALKAGLNGFTWDGKTTNGSIAADGKYTFSVSAKQGSNDVTATALAVGVVGGVTRNGQTFNLDVTGLGTFALSDVREIL